MEAVILAAGMGERMGLRDSPKPMATLLGMSLLERVIRACVVAGVSEFVVVVGYQAERVRQALRAIRIEGIRVQTVDNPDWQKGNAHSLAIGARAVKGERFLVVMADHVIEPEVIRRALAVQPPREGLVMAVDRLVDGEHIDPEDATRVRFEGERVVEVGKRLPHYDAVDMGVFLCDTGVVSHLEAAVAQGVQEINAWVNALAAGGRVAMLDLTGLFWIDVDTPKMLNRARLLMLRRLIKPTDGPISRWLNRPISLRISSILAAVRRVQPNHLSLLSFFIAVVGGLLLLPAKVLTDVTAAVLVQLSSILDGCDGEIARLRYQTSTFGAWLDRVLDRYSDGFLVMMLTYRAYQSSAFEWVWVLGGMTMIGVLVSSYLAIPAELEIAPSTSAWLVRLGRDVRLFVTSMGILFQFFVQTLFILLLLGHLEMIRRLKRVWDLRATSG